MLSKFALLFIVFVDLMGQGLIIPVINTLIMDPNAGYVPAITSEATRHFDYGLVIGVFYLSWFLGAVYISNLSDSIGRKAAMLICLAGALVGYVLTILAIAEGSLWLMILGRAITGFTAGNQPIAQAAMADLSRDDAEKTRNLGYVVLALGAGLVAGPLIAGSLTETALIGDMASLSLPFYVAIGLVLVSMGLIALFFQEKLETRAPLDITPMAVFRLIGQIVRHPAVLRIAAVYFCFMFTWNTCYVFADNYLTSRFAVGTLGGSLAMLLIGGALGVSGAFLVSAFGARFSKQAIVAGAAVVMALAAAVVLASPSVALAYVALVPMAAAFPVGYATLLSMFSATVSKSQQGWVMGVTTALWTLGAGSTSLIGGELMRFGIVVPYLIGIGSIALALILIAALWRDPDVRRIAVTRGADAG